MIEKNASIFVAGHNGLVGSAIKRALEKRGYNRIVVRSREELDLTNQQSTAEFFENTKPEYVVLAAAKVGGIMANNLLRAEFIYENLQIQNNVIHSAWKTGTKKLLFLGSSCIYPREAPQPLQENYLLTSPLEYTNEPYAIAKIAGIKSCESYNLQYGTNFISVMPTNLYGPHDNFNLQTSHVLPAIMRKMHLAHCLETGNFEGIRADLRKRPVEQTDGNSQETEILELLEKYGISQQRTGAVELHLWGTGSPFREFMYVDDMADACVFILENIDFKDLVPSDSKEIRNTHLNIGTGKEISIRELAELVAKTAGFKGRIVFDASKPDGTPRKLLDVSKLESLGWKAKTNLAQGLKLSFEHYLHTIKEG